MRYVLLGGGVASLSCAKAIRQRDKTSPIFVISQEKYPPYRRPMISTILEGKTGFQEILLLDDTAYKDLGVKLILGCRAEWIDTQNRMVLLGNKEKLEYDRLLIATGADPKFPKIPGIDLRGIHTFRKYEDAASIISALPNVKNILIVGAGPAGIKAATALAKHDKSVYMVELTDQLLPNILDKPASEIMLKKLSLLGIKVILEDQVMAFEGKELVSRAILKNNGTLDTELVILTIGVSPAIDFLEGSGIGHSNGIIVNSFLETNVSGVFGAGDAIVYKEISSGLTTNTPIWPEAVAQGEIAGLNMVGLGVTYEGALRRNVLQVHHTDFMSIGLIAPNSDSQTSVSTLDITPKISQPDFYRKIVFEGSILKGIIMVNNINYGGFFAQLIRNKVELNFNVETFLVPGYEREAMGKIFSGRI